MSLEALDTIQLAEEEARQIRLNAQADVRKALQDAAAQAEQIRKDAAAQAEETVAGMIRAAEADAEKEIAVLTEQTQDKVRRMEGTARERMPQVIDTLVERIVNG